MNPKKNTLSHDQRETHRKRCAEYYQKNKEILKARASLRKEAIKAQRKARKARNKWGWAEIYASLANLPELEDLEPIEDPDTMV